MTISVIIPALNEAARITATLAQVRRQPGVAEVIVADGGSVDGTPALAARHATVLAAPRGRGRQMNHGAAHSTGDVLFFLHADTLLSDDAFPALRRVLADPAAEAGTFRLAFDRWTPLLRLYSFATRFPVPSLGFGDRGLFVRRYVFEAVGGFAEVPLFEDLDLVRRLHRRGGFRFLPAYLTTSARRFEVNGPLRQQCRNAYLWLHYLRGTDPHRLAHHYPYPENEAT